MDDAAEVITVGVMMILVVLLVLQPMVSRLLATEGGGAAPSAGGRRVEPDMISAMPSNPALAAPTGGGGMSEPAYAKQAEDSLVDIQGVEGKVKASTLKKVEEIVDNYPTETVSVIRSWMTQES